jgi:hypothetical protein
MEDHKQYNLPDLPTDNLPININKDDRTLNIKDKLSANDNEVANLLGQKFQRVSVNTLITGSVYSVSIKDFLIGITSLSYAPSIGLPLPSLVGPGKHYIVKDEVGGAASTTITVRVDGEKTIDGAATATINTNYGSKEFYSNGANWFTK